MHQHTDALALELARTAQHLRLDVLDMVVRAQSGHLGGPYSCAESSPRSTSTTCASTPPGPTGPSATASCSPRATWRPSCTRSSPGAASSPSRSSTTFRRFPTRLEGHPDRKLPGVEMVAGPLGHGIAVGAGMAWALTRGVPKPSAVSAPSAFAARARVYVLLGDGELDAGVVWEGALFAAKMRLGNLTAIVDANGIQQTGATADVLPGEPLADKWAAFGWHVQEVHGHNVREVLDALDRAEEVHARPSVIIARTTKGRGVSYMEYDHRWHGGLVPTPEQEAQARAEIAASLAALGEGTQA